MLHPYLPPSPPPNRIVTESRNYNRGVKVELDESADVGANFRGTDHFPPYPLARKDESGCWAVGNSPRLLGRRGSREAVVDHLLQCFGREPLVPHRLGPVPNYAVVCIEGWVGFAFS